MGLSHHEQPPNSFKRCKVLSCYLKEVFSCCHTCGRRVSSSKMEEESSGSDFNDDQEVVVSEIRSRAMEAKSRRKASFRIDGFSWVFSPPREVVFMIPKPMKTNDNCEHEETEDFLSVCSSFSHYSSAATTVEQFLSIKTNFSSLSELEFGREVGQFFVQEFWCGVDLEDLQRRSIIREICHCEGWPFGLCRKALLLPPLPKSPSESWSWRKGAKFVKQP